MKELSNYEFLPLRGGDSTLHRGSGEGLAPVLLACTGDGSLASRERLAHEYALRADLDASWAARPIALSRHNGRWTLVMEDPGGEPLDQLLHGPLAIPDFLRLAVSLTKALHRVHERGLIHKNIKPSNILVHWATGRVWLTGFGIASRLLREHNAPAPPEVIAGTLAYMAPEQTGRMNRSVDSRSDLYSLGVSFYEMLTGRLPFSAADAMEWVHCHIARQAVPPDEHEGTIPKSLSSIVMKLLAKTPEDRYQTAAGLDIDLRQCSMEWEALGRIPQFPLARRDLSQRLLIPEKLYGRTQEIDALIAAFDRVVARRTAEFVLLTGYPGVGKSSIVNELHKALVPSRGLFATGKFDQYQRDTPYSTIAQAFQGLVGPLLAQGEGELEVWRTRLREALGPNGALMVNLVPELELVIGAQPPVADLSPLETQERFQRVFQKFVSAFASKEHPMVLFLDDLQWADVASLGLLQELATHPDIRDLLLIGAYRDNEVGPAHPLLGTLAAIRGTRTCANMVIGPLTRADLTDLVADTLRCTRSAAESLAQLVHQKTGGNPFFTTQFLEALCEERLLSLHPDEAVWKWDLERIRDRGFTDNVVDLMIVRIGRLQVDTQQTLKRLACLGNSTEGYSLAMVLGKPQADIDAQLLDMVRAGLLLRVDGHYVFAHDRIQQAAYELIDRAELAAVHLQIGRSLMAETPADLREDKAFEIVNQLNRGAAMIESQDELEELAALNLIAGKRAKAATAYASALHYLAAGEAKLAPDRWDRTKALAFALSFHRAECAFLTGDPTTAERDLAALSCRAATLADLASVACLRIAVSMTVGASQHAIEVGLQCLESLGISWSSHPTDEEVQQEYERIWRRMAARTIEALIDLPPMSDAKSQATMEVLAAFIPAAHWIDRNLYCLIIGRMVNLGLEHGNDAGSCIAYVYLGAVLGPYMGDYQAGYRFGKLALDLAEKRRLNRFDHRLYAVLGHHVIPWVRHLNRGRGLMKRAADTAHEAGDLTFEVFSCMNLTTNLLAAGDPLEVVEGHAERALALAQRARYGLVAELITGQIKLIRALQGSEMQSSAERDEFERSLQSAPAILACWHWIRTLQARVFAGEAELGVVAAEKAKDLLWTTPSFFETAEYHFYAALARASCCATAPASARERHLRELLAHHRQIAAWAENCPENFSNRAALVAAEIARLEQRDLEAMRLYEHAIRSARENGFIQNEALANELASRFYLARDFGAIARSYLRAARDCYLRWGAAGKVLQLEASFSSLGEELDPPRPTATIGAHVEDLDLATVIKVSQAVSGEIVLEQLIDKLMRTALEHAGAERALLILEREGALQLEAEATTVRGVVTVYLSPGRVSAAALPESILAEVRRTRQPLILDDASAHGGYCADPYVRRHRSRSVLCLPLIKQTALIGVLYLENNLASHVFTPARSAVLALLASQAAISLENAYLYADLQIAEERMRNDELELRVTIDTLPAFILRAEADGRPDLVSGRILDYSGLSKEDWMREGWAKSIHPEDFGRVMREWRSALANARPLDTEMRFRKADGSYRWFHARSVPRRGDDGTIIKWYATIHDIEDRKQVEEELRQSEEQWRDVFENNPTMYFMVDASGRILAVNPLGAEHLGYGVRELVGRQVFGVIHESDRGAVKGHFQNCLAHLGEPHSWEARKVCKDGRTLWVRETGKAVPRMSGAIVLMACEDITERKQVEADKAHLEAQLRQSQKMEAMGTLAGGIAHDFNNILGAILGYGELVQQTVAAGTDVHRYIDNVMQAGGRAKSLVERILAFSRSGLSERSTIDVQAVIEETLELLAAGSLAPGVVLKTRLAAPGAAVVGDATQLHQVAMNLCTNALQAMENGGLLAVELDRVDVAQERELMQGKLAAGTYLRLRVTDTGSGIPSQVLDRMFDPFFTTKSPGKGTGLGLSLVHGIVADLGGAIDVSTAMGSGTTFIIWLPSTGEVAAPSREPVTLLPHGQGQTVLVVDNEQSLVALAEETLAELGYEPVGFNSSTAALRAFLESPLRFDIVLSDESMPDLTGTALAAEIAALRPDLPIVLMSGFAGARLHERARALGIRELLRKPLQRKDIAECFGRVLACQGAAN